jgi:hypothetical protein
MGGICYEDKYRLVTRWKFFYHPIYGFFWLIPLYGWCRCKQMSFLFGLK